MIDLAQLITPYGQIVATLLGAIYNGILTFEAYPKFWKTLFSGITTAILLWIAMATAWACVF